MDLTVGLVAGGLLGWLISVVLQLERLRDVAGNVALGVAGAWGGRWCRAAVADDVPRGAVRVDLDALAASALGAAGLVLVTWVGLRLLGRWLRRRRSRGG
ncbi:hypothetical protein [Piscinibacter sakaiensis]|uniref:GlsB/YeaQ/YmgE family stress response membrane protein n=1 Tax=Piscinibacter sakaiensis TaxID=1547922 RepID=A0A0K8P8C0_PISS1|nr:hypothetical protein [Piscinibacter sakaiensis]GAP38749.1 hypothetical protein ISF6_5302 [Piscinibacter sakaiensis]